jgi:hypothetical protein
LQRRTKSSFFFPRNCSISSISHVVSTAVPVFGRHSSTGLIDGWWSLGLQIFLVLSPKIIPFLSFPKLVDIWWITSCLPLFICWPSLSVDCYQTWNKQQSKQRKNVSPRRQFKDITPREDL